MSRRKPSLDLDTHAVPAVRRPDLALLLARAYAAAVPGTPAVDAVVPPDEWLAVADAAAEALCGRSPEARTVARRCAEAAGALRMLTEQMGTLWADLSRTGGMADQVADRAVSPPKRRKQ